MLRALFSIDCIKYLLLAKYYHMQNFKNSSILKGEKNEQFANYIKASLN